MTVPLERQKNISDVKVRVREQLGLGDASLLNVGQTENTVAAGDDIRIVDAALKVETALQPLTLAQMRSTITRGKGINDALWSARIEEFENGERGTLFIWSDPAPSELVAGYNAGQQIWIGNNPVGTPGSGHAAGSSVVVVNGNNRDALYGINVLVGAANAGAGFVDAFVCGMEINIYGDFAATVTDAFSGGNRKNGLEITSQGSTARTTSAAMIWSADSSGSSWWYQGLSISRCVQTGINFQKNPGSNNDGISAFSVAAIYDKSDSASVLKIDGSHQSIIDLSSVTATGYFVKGRSSATTTLRLDNLANQAFDLVIGSGNSVAQQSQFIFMDRSTAKWSLIKTTANALAIFDNAGGFSPIFLDGNTANAVQIRVGGADKRIEVGAADSGGTGFRSLRVAN